MDYIHSNGQTNLKHKFYVFTISTKKCMYGGFVQQICLIESLSSQKLSAHHKLTRALQTELFPVLGTMQL